MPFDIDEYSLTATQKEHLDQMCLNDQQRDTLKRAGALFVEAISYFHQIADQTPARRAKYISERNAAYERARFLFQLAGEPEMDEGLQMFWRNIE